MRTIVVCCCCLLVAILCFADELPDDLLFRGPGFSMTPPAAPAGATGYQVASIYLPPSDGFAPNVNIQLQSYAGTMADYAALSNQQFLQMAWSVLAEEISEEAITWEYSGNFQGHDLHWYCRAVRGDTIVYLVTAGALATQWEDVGPELKSSVNSFELED